MQKAIKDQTNMKPLKIG